MSWAVGFNRTWNRWIGYGVPAYCDHPKCRKEINRGMAFLCGGGSYGDRHKDGCGLYFCDEHGGGYLCPRCLAGKPPYKHPKPEHPRWTAHQMTHESWAEWRKEQGYDTTLRIKGETNVD